MVESMRHLENENSVRYDERYQCDNDMEYLNEAMPDINGPDEFRYCAGCGCRIDDRYFLMAAEKHWHVHCLQCYDCKLHLDTELTCFVRDGNVYCKEDYYRRFSIKCCAKCRLGIAANEMVMRARDFVYHMRCFACCSCNKTLLPGDYFGMRDNVIYCREDYEGFVQCGTPGPPALQSPSPGVIPGTGLDNIPFYPATKRTQKGRPRKRKIAAPEGSGFVHRPMGYMGGEHEGPPELMGPDGYLQSQQTRQKRVRTSFKHHQLRAMKSYFNLNHNPDAKDLKQLAQKTGLSKRVLQVWFQNARAKYRRHVLKQETNKTEGRETTEEFRLSDDEKTEDKSYAEVCNNSSSSLSDMSSTPSLGEISSGLTEYDNIPANSSLSELFSSTISTIN